MKKLILIGMAVMSLSLGARAELGYGERFKQEADRFIAEIKSVGEGLRRLVTYKGEAEKNQKKETLVVADSNAKVTPVIIESCDHCKDLCNSKDQSAERFA